MGGWGDVVRSRERAEMNEGFRAAHFSISSIAGEGQHTANRLRHSSLNRLSNDYKHMLRSRAITNDATSTITHGLHTTHAYVHVYITLSRRTHAAADVYTLQVFHSELTLQT